MQSKNARLFAVLGNRTHSLFSCLAAMIVVAVVSQPVDGASLYWTQNGEIYRANLNGSNVAPVYTRGPSDFLTVNLDIDLQNGHIYWLGVYPSGPFAIRRSDLDGQSIQDVVTSGLGPAAIYGVAVDAVNQKLYSGSHVALGPGSGIRTVNTDGTGLSQLPFTVFYPHQIEVDPVNSKVYFGDVVGFNGLRRANFDGTGVETLATGIVVGEALDLDIAGGRIFYSHNEVGVDVHQLWSANLDGSDPLLLRTVNERPNDIELWGGQMYWSTQFGIHRANLDGTDATKIVTFDAGNAWGADGFAIVPEPASVVLGGIGAAIFGAYGFLRRLRQRYAHSQQAARYASIGRLHVLLVGSLALLAAALGPITNADAASLYFTSDGSIKRANSDGTGLEFIYNYVSYPGGPNNLRVNGIDIDPTTQKLYWYGTYPNDHAVLLRSNLDGTGIEPVITTGLGPIIYGFALDSVNDKLYMHQHISGGPGSGIRTANTDGTGLASLPFTAYYATDIIPEPVSGKLYFHDNVFYQGIRRSNLDGTSVENLVFGDARGVGLALDLTASKLYYTDAATEQIFRSNLDGSGQELLLSPGHMPRDIELFDGQMYWMNQFGVYRANTDGTGMTQVLPLSGANWGSNDNLVIYEAVPEPATVALAAVAVPIAIFAGVIRRRRK